MLSWSHIRCGLAAASSIRTINQSNDPGPPNDVLNALNSALNCQAAVVHSFKWCLKWIMPTRCYYKPRFGFIYVCLLAIGIDITAQIADQDIELAESSRNESMLICEDYIEHIHPFPSSFPSLSLFHSLLSAISLWKVNWVKMHFTALCLHSTS